MALWTPNDAASFTTAWDFRANTIAGLSDGDPVSTWADQSGVGGQDAAASGGDRPTYVATGPFSGPAVRFNYNRMLFDCANTIVDAVAGYEPGSHGFQVAPEGVPNASNTGDPKIQTFSETEASFMAVAAWTGEAWTLRFDGQQVAAADWSFVSAPPTQDGVFWHLGKWNSQGGGGVYGLVCSSLSPLVGQVMIGDRPSGSRSLDGYIVAFGAGEGPADPADLERIEGWLAWDNGAVGLLPAGHAYKSAAPTASGGGAAAAAILEAADTASAAGALGLSAALAKAEVGDMLGAAAEVPVAALLAVAEADDAVSAVAARGGSGAALIEAGDALAATGRLGLLAAFALAESGDLLAAGGGRKVFADLPAVEADDVLAGAGRRFAWTPVTPSGATWIPVPAAGTGWSKL